MAAQHALENGDRAGALRGYQQLLDIYRQMEGANMETIHRELAHDQLQQMYDAISGKPVQVQEPVQSAPVRAQPLPLQVEPAQPLFNQGQPVVSQKVTPKPFMPVASEPLAPRPTVPKQQSSFSSREILVIGVFVAIIGFVIFIKPEYIGLAVAEPALSVPIDTTYAVDSPLTVNLGEVPTSIRLSGTVSGEGIARVYYKIGDERLLVFDSSLLTLEERNGQRLFENSCIGTCVLTGAPKKVQLEIEVDRVSLHLDSLSYTTREAVNRAPVWLGDRQRLVLARNTPTTLDLSQLFSDPDGDKLGFIASEAPGVTVNVQGSRVTFRADSSGERHVALVASDGTTALRVPFTLEVQ